MKTKQPFLILLSICSLIYGQKTEKIKGDTKFSYSQKYGITENNIDYTLIVYYDFESLKFKTSEKQSFTSYNVTKKTIKYIIGKTEEENYSFYDIKNKRLFNIDYYMKRYLTAGYGSGSVEIKQTISKMMEMLKKGKSQKDVIQYLIDQINYDF